VASRRTARGPHRVTLFVKAVSRRPVTRVLVGLAAAVLIALTARQAAASVPRFLDWVDRLDTWGLVVFGLGYVIATIAFVPGGVLTLAAGAIFGIAKGTLLVLLSATIGASTAFLISRHVARRAIERRLADNRRFAAIDRAVGREGRKIVFLLRLSPVFPFNVLNYALGLTKVRFSDFLIASIGMLPGTLLYVYAGRVIGDVARVASGTRVPKGAGYYLLLGIGLIATIVVVTLVTRTARRALQEVTDVDRRPA
jgi:uncharacterized membrane protein YdjX (TVP38/TMEM64 family)